MLASTPLREFPFQRGCNRNRIIRPRGSSKNNLQFKILIFEGSYYLWCLKISFFWIFRILLYFLFSSFLSLYLSLVLVMVPYAVSLSLLLSVLFYSLLIFTIRSIYCCQRMSDRRVVQRSVKVQVNNTWRAALHWNNAVYNLHRRVHRKFQNLMFSSSL